MMSLRDPNREHGDRNEVDEQHPVGHTKELVARIPGQHAEHGSDPDDIRELPAERFDVACARGGNVTGRGRYYRHAKNCWQAEHARERRIAQWRPRPKIWRAQRIEDPAPRPRKTPQA